MTILQSGFGTNCFSLSLAASKSMGKSSSPGRHVMGVSPFRTTLCSSFGNPQRGCPIKFSPRSTIFSGVRSFWTIKIAISPTIFEDGVTFTRPPSISLTVRYISFTSSNLCPRPRLSTCGFRLVYWPPGIS